MARAVPFPGIGKGAPSAEAIAESWDEAYERAAGRTPQPRFMPEQIAAIVSAATADQFRGFGKGSRSQVASKAAPQRAPARPAKATAASAPAPAKAPAKSPPTARAAPQMAIRHLSTERAGAAISMLLPLVLDPRWSYPGAPRC